MIHIGGAAAIEGRQAEARAQERCRTKGTPEATRSRDALDALDQRIRTLAVGGRPASSRCRPSLASRVTMLPARCRAGGRAGVRAPAVPADLVGGRRPSAGWRRTSTGPASGAVDDLRDHVVFPPGPRKVLALDTAPADTLAPLLCRLADEDCGRETQGWAERARDAFSAAVVQDRVQDEDAFPVNSQALAARCEAEVRRDGTTPEYAKWIECLAEHRVPGWALPLGRFRAPDRGWLVIRGRRGHYEFCDELACLRHRDGRSLRGEELLGTPSEARRQRRLRGDKRRPKARGRGRACGRREPARGRLDDPAGAAGRGGISVRRLLPDSQGYGPDAPATRMWAYAPSG